MTDCSILTKTCKDCLEPKPIADFYETIKKNRPGKPSYRSSYCKPCEYERTKATAIRLGMTPKKYGITKDEYYEFIAQYPVCQICGSNKRLCVDHSHATNKIRGRLCHNCNTAIGLLKEDPVNLLQAVQYLNAFSKN